MGCDTPAGSVVLERGHVLDPVAIGLLLQLRVSEVHIRSPIRVGVLSTGNELLGPDEHDASLTTTGPYTRRESSYIAFFTVYVWTLVYTC